MEGPAAPPRANGELAFEAPWESRLFGLTAALVEAGHLDWACFQAALIDAVGAGGDRPYWRSWLAAFTRLAVDDRGLVPARAVHDRAATFATRPPDHDHHHHHTFPA